VRAGCRCLIVRGENSTVFSDADAATFAELVPGARRVTVPRSGHAVHRDNPGALVDAVRAFLGEVDA
jgi:pimeloyl-ACP methyl ester carboxylesterase